MPADAQRLDRNGATPHGVEYMYWSSRGSGYDAAADVFTSVEDLDPAQVASLERGASDVHLVRCRAGRFPVVLVDMVARDNGFRMRWMYLATLQGRETLRIAYVAHSWHQQQSDLLWADLKQGLTCGPSRPIAAPRPHPPLP